MAERASETDGLHFSVFENALEPDDGIRLEQRLRCFRILQTDRRFLNRLDEDGREFVNIHLQARLQRILRRQSRAHAALLPAEDRLMQLEDIAPDRLRSKGVI